MSFFKSRYKIKGLYLLDEPETALSPKSQVELLKLLQEMSRLGHAQFVIATHSPILLACPGSVIEVFSDTHIYLDDTPAITPLQLRTKCRRLHMEYGLDLIIIDYLQLMGGDSRTDNRVQEVSYISRNLKVLARELNVPVLAAAQLSRAVEQRSDKRPVLSDLRESGSLEQDADVVLFIYRPDQYETDTLKQNLAEIIVAKHRNGPVGSVELVFRRSLAKFENAETRRVQLGEEAPMGAGR